MTWIAATLAYYKAILLGFVIGTAAKYGLALSEGRKLTWRGVLADILLMGMVALAAQVAVERAGLQGNAAVMCGALFALSSDRIIRLIREAFLKRIDGAVGGLAEATRAADVTQVPAGSGAPDTIEVSGPTPGGAVARAGKALRAAYPDPHSEPIPRGMRAQLRKLEDDA